MAWGNYSNGQIPFSAMKAVKGQYFEPKMAALMAELIKRAAVRGVTVSITEGYRPLGVPGDQYALTASKAASKRSTQWFQYGRMRRGLTPAAARPLRFAPKLNS